MQSVHTYQEENPSGTEPLRRFARPKVVIKLPWGLLREKSGGGGRVRPAFQTLTPSKTRVPGQKFDTLFET